MELITPDQRAAAAQTLADAFADDPLMHIIATDERKRRDVGPWFLGGALDYGMRWGEAVANEDASAVAVWLPPGETTMSPLRMMRVGLWRLPFKLGLRGAASFMSALSATEKFHKTVEGPHWYLVAVGTSPSQQGQGLGSALIEHGTAKADAAGIPCYLETATDRNIAFYSKRGFNVIGQANVRGFTLTSMVRQPRAT